MLEHGHATFTVDCRPGRPPRIKSVDMLKKQNVHKCVYCEGALEEVNGKAIWPAREDLVALRFLICWKCSAWVGLNDEGHPKGYPAKKHIRELREMVLSAWHTVCNSGAMTWDKADRFRDWLREEHGFDTADLGWLEEEELRQLLTLLDRMVIPDTPEVDALFL